MRTIKFRGKILKLNIGCDKNVGDWVYGDLHLLSKTPHIHANSRKYIIDTETIGQYTGLKDKNGVEIFEGDILQETYSNKNVLVVYDAPQFCYADNSFGYRFLNHPENFTVVGNIHDNPELLKGE